jgi:hypothetical protein
MAISPIPTFAELILHGHKAELARLFDQLPAFLPDTWQRDGASEAKAQDVGVEGGEYRCYQFIGNQELPLATLWLFVEDEKAQAVNITAPSLFELGYERYNAILAQFTKAVKQAISEMAIAVEIAPWQEPTLEGVLQPEPARLFRKFAKLANPTTGSLHPADEERWQDFLISAHQHQVNPDEDLLRYWLSAECHWSEQIIDHALEAMRTSLELLRKYEQTLSRTTYGHVA